MFEPLVTLLAGAVGLSPFAVLYVVCDYFAKKETRKDKAKGIPWRKPHECSHPPNRQNPNNPNGRVRCMDCGWVWL